MRLGDFKPAKWFFREIEAWRRRRPVPSYRRTSRAWLLKELLIAMIPFVLSLSGVALVSFGLFSFAEDEAILEYIITGGRESAVLGIHRLPVPSPAESEETGASDTAAAETTPSETTPSAETTVETTSETSAETTSATAAETTAETTAAETTAAETTAAETDGSGTGRLVVPFYYYGDQIGIVRISSADLEVNVYQGDREDELQIGAGHYGGSLFPGQGGNIVLAGHRTTYFRNLEYVEIGDRVEFETTYVFFAYQVCEIKILDADAFESIVEETAQEQLTMYTCHPFNYVGNAPQRYVVLCDLLESDIYS